jgi:hypothetical protein
LKPIASDETSLGVAMEESWSKMDFGLLQGDVFRRTTAQYQYRYHQSMV